MSVFVPFKAIRPAKQLVKAVASKPYDVLNAREAKEESDGNPLSYYRVIKPEIEFPRDTDPFSAEVYARGRENLRRMVDDGIMVQDSDEMFYVYRLQMGDHVQTGLVGCCSIDDYFNNNIKKHESTKPKIEADRKRHIVESKVNYEAVFLSYPKVDEIDTLVNASTVDAPLYDFVSEDGVKHTIWAINDPYVIEQINNLFASRVPKIYIADGHHRTAAGALAGKELREKDNGQENRYDYLMCVVFPDDQVQVLEYNRVVKDLNRLTPAEYLNAVREHFDIAETEGQYHPESHQHIGMYLEGKWYKLAAREGTFDPDDLVDRLGFTILSRQLLEPILNITDLRNDDRIEFIGGIRGHKELEKRVDSGDMKVAFAMYPISMTEIIHIADEDLNMPPKITWFEPKLRSGLFVHSLNGALD